MVTENIGALQWILAAAGIFLLYLLYWFGRSGRREQRRRYNERARDVGEQGNGEPYISKSDDVGENLKLDLNEVEIKELTDQVSTNSYADKIFEEVDAFYEKVIDDKPEYDEVKSMAPVKENKPAPSLEKVLPHSAATSSADAESDKPEASSNQQQVSTQEEVSIPAWLKTHRQLREQIAEIKESKLNTVGLFKSEESNVSEPAKIVNKENVPNVVKVNNEPVRKPVNIGQDSVRSAALAKAAAKFKNTGDVKQNFAKKISEKLRQESVEESKTESVEESKTESVEEPKTEFVEESKTEFVEESKTESRPEQSQAGKKKGFWNAKSAKKKRLRSNKHPRPKSVNVEPAASDHITAKQSNKTMDTLAAENALAPVKQSREVNAQSNYLQGPPSNQLPSNQLPSSAGAVAIDNTVLTKAVTTPKPQSHGFEVAFYLIAKEESCFMLADIAIAANAAGLQLGDDQSFYLDQNTGFNKEHMFSVRSLDDDCNFAANDIQQKSTGALVFKMEPSNNVLGRLHILDSMLRIAKEMEKKLDAEMYDIGYCRITDLMITHLRRQVQDFDLKQSH